MMEIDNINKKQTNKYMNSNSSNDKQLAQTLFFKVFNNRYLLKCILNQIQQTEWIKYEDYQNYNVGNRIKFKNITCDNLEWMITNKQYELLKCKIQSPNEYIDITLNGLTKLFGLVVGSNGSGTETNSNEKDPNQLFKELLSLLFKFKREEIEKFDLISIAVKYFEDVSAVLQILFDEPFSLRIYDKDISILRWAFKHCTNSKIVSILIDNIHPGTTIPQHIKTNSIYMAINNNNGCNQEIIKLIFGNSNLYTTPSDEDCNGNEDTNKRFKSFDGTSTEQIGNKNNKDDEDSTHRIKIGQLISFSDSEITNILINYGYIRNNNSLPFNDQISFEEFFKKPKSNYQLFKIKYDEIIKQQQDETMDAVVVDRVQEIFKLYSKESSHYYSLYLSKYDEPIKGLTSIGDLKVLFNHIFKMFSVNCLQWVLSNYSKAYISNLTNIISQPVSYSIEGHSSSLLYTQVNNETLFKFIKLYTSFTDMDYISNCSCDDEIIRLAILSKSQQEYNEFLSLIPNNYMKNSNRSFKKLLPTVWNSLLYDIHYSNELEIKDTHTIDWLVKYAKNIIDIKDPRFKFSTLELLKYSGINLDKYWFSPTENLIDDTTSKRFKHLFYKSIGQCDIVTLQFINDNVKLGVGDDYYISVEEIESQPLDQLNGLIKYCNMVEFQNFNQDFFRYFLRKISNNQYIVNGSGDSGTELTLINYNKFTNSITYLLVESVIHYKVNIIKFLLEKSGFSFSKDYRILTDIWQVFSEAYDIKNFIYSKAKFNTFIATDQVVNDIIEMISLVLVEFNGKIESKEYQVEYLTILEEIINYLYKRLIQVKNISIDAVRPVYQMIRDNKFEIKFQHTMYHSIYYLSIVSGKLIKYIMGLPFIFNIVRESEQIHYRLDRIDKSYIGYNLEKYLNSSIYTFDYLFGDIGSTGGGNVSFNELLGNLVFQLSINPATTDRGMVTKETDYFNKSLNYNLEYFLNIHRVDLFSNHLDFISNQLVNSNVVIGSFPIILSNNGGISGIKMVLQDIEFYLPFNNGSGVGERVFYFTSKVYQYFFKSNYDQELFEKFSMFSNCFSLFQFLSKLDTKGCCVIEYLLDHFEFINSNILIKFIRGNNVVIEFWNNLITNNNNSDHLISDYIKFKFKKLLK